MEPTTTSTTSNKEETSDTSSSALQKFSFVDSDNALKILQNGKLAIADYDTLETVICRFAKLKQQGVSNAILEGLQEAIRQFTVMMRDQLDPSFDFYKEVLPRIIEWACNKQWYLDLPLLEAGREDEVVLTATQVLYLLANSFFLNVKRFSQIAPPYLKHKADIVGELDWTMLYRTKISTSVHRILCQLSYFTQMSRIDLSQQEVHSIVFSRHILHPDQEPKWNTIDVAINAKGVKVFEARMEDSDASVFIDFANKQLHIGEIIPSLTQEEVLFSCCPEAFVGLLFCEQMKDNEVIFMRGLRRFSDYEGYLSTFKFTKFFSPAMHPVDSLALDAVCWDHFKDVSVDRDLGKAFLGFLQCKGRKIVTGHWGCGAFGGDKVHKFLQQVLAATVANVELDYSTFKDKECAEKFQKILAEIDAKRMTVATAYNIMNKFKPSKNQSFYEYLMNAFAGV